MKRSDFAPQFPTVWGANAGEDYIQYPIPQTSTALGRASLDQGFPAATFTPPEAGGSFVFGEDENGVLRMVSTSAQNYETGIVPVFSASFATSIGGYPQGAIISDASTFGVYWISTADNNTTTPGAANATWVAWWIDSAKPHGRAVFTTSSGFEVPSGVYSIRARLWGGGGGGGGTGGNGGAGAGGGGAGYAEGILSVTPGQSLSLTVGAGGSASQGGNGTVGGSSSVASVSAFGGGYGVAGNGSNATGPGGGGSGSGAPLIINGYVGQQGSVLGSDGRSLYVGGQGGGAFASSTTPFSTGAGPGYVGAFPGGGGGGSVGANQTGGYGAGGLVVLEW